nr:MAG TPA: hypothetical protein [Caudoviricetes sp.]
MGRFFGYFEGFLNTLIKCGYTSKKRKYVCYILTILHNYNIILQKYCKNINFLLTFKK